MTCQSLAEDNIGLAYYFAQRYMNKGIEYDDIVSMAYIGLMKAANTFDETKGFKFATYAAVCIENEIKMVLRKKIHYTVSFEEPIDEGEYITIEDVIKDSSDFEETLLEHDNLQYAMRYLSPLERWVIEVRYLSGDEISQVEATKIIGITQSYLSRIETRALRKLRNIIIK